MRTFSRFLLFVTVVVAVLFSVCAKTAIASSTNWRSTAGIAGGDISFNIILFGASLSSVDGYDGQPVYDPAGKTGCATMFYRVNGSSWSGPTGFYYMDLTSPIPDGGSYTWDNIYLWAQNYNVAGGVGQLMITSFYPEPPSYYMCRLVLDYVPEYMNWTGPTVYEFRALGALLDLPIPTVDNPLDGVRMHLTVYAGPIPEPSTLATFLGLFGAVSATTLWRRRRR